MSETVADTYRRLANKHGEDIPRQELKILMQSVLNLSNTEWVTQGDNLTVSARESRALQMLVDRRLTSEPLAHILGEWEFWGLPFYVSEHTLVPRADTETIIEAALKSFKNRDEPASIVDLGTGTGCILIALLHEFEQSAGVGLDLSKEALVTARRNAVRNNVHRRAQFICGSWWDSLDSKFDLIVSNPPYIRREDIESLMPEVRLHDPKLALDGGDNGFEEIKSILKYLRKYLSPNGTVLIEIGYDQAGAMTDLVSESNLYVKNVHYDLNGHARVIEIIKTN